MRDTEFKVGQNFRCVDSGVSIGRVRKVQHYSQVSFVNINYCVRAMVARHELGNMPFAFGHVFF